MAGLSWRRIGAAACALAGVVTLSSFKDTRSSGLEIHAGPGLRSVESQLRGEEDLSALARTAAEEDAWLYMRGTWTDIGYDEKPLGVAVDLPAVAAAAGTPGGARVVFYHIHPCSEDPRVVRPPSLQDLHALIQLEGAAGRTAAGVVLDGRGRWSYSLTAELRDALVRDPGRTSSFAASHGYGPAGNAASRLDREYPLLVWEALLPDQTRTREARIEAFIAGAGSLGVLIDYAAVRSP